MNYEYKFVDKKIILTEQEHEQVLGDMQSGKNISVLRGGKLIMNMNLVGTVQETTQDMPENEEQYLARLRGETQKALDSGNRSGGFKKILPKMPEGWNKRPLLIRVADPLISYGSNAPRNKLQEAYQRGEVDIYGEKIEVKSK